MSIRTFPHPRNKPKIKPEKRTRMLPSEALVIGRMAYPIITKKWQDGDAFCAAALINYIRGDTICQADVLNREGGRTFVYPCSCIAPDPAALGFVIMHLSDEHSERRNRITRLFRREYWSQGDISNWLRQEGF